MNTRVLPVSEIAAAVKILQGGGLVAFPTDTVYGVGALAFREEAIQSIYAAKKRPLEKSIPVLVADVEDFAQVAERIPPSARILAAKFLPGALTLVIPKNPTLPPSISADQTVAVRVPDNEDARALLRAAGALAVTSANISGQPSPTTAAEALAQLGGRIPLILDGGQTRGGIPSTVVDCASGEIRVLRQGKISLAEILNALKN